MPRIHDVSCYDLSVSLNSSALANASFDASPTFSQSNWSIPSNWSVWAYSSSNWSALWSHSNLSRSANGSVSANASSKSWRRSSCDNLRHDVVFEGDDLPGNLSGRSMNVSRCCAACEELEACAGWSHDGVQSKCWLKTALRAVNSDGAVSGSKLGSSAFEVKSMHDTVSEAAPTYSRSARSTCTTVTGGRCPNILYLMADDLRPQLRSYGQDFMITPNLDGLAANGLQFDFAYTQFALCAPSRNSFLSGRRPDRTRVLSFTSTFRDAPGGRDWLSMPQFFKSRGYFTSSAGKIFDSTQDDVWSWTFVSNASFKIPCSRGDFVDNFGNFCGITAESVVQITDEELIVEEGIKRMQRGHDSGRPWWVGIGMNRPHTPFRTPFGFHGDQLYGVSIDGHDITKLPKHPRAPEDSPAMAGNWDDQAITDKVAACRECLLPADRTLAYRRWYYAAVTWTDYAIGQVFQKLRGLGSDVVENTIVVFHSDHGFHLGELNQWAKKTNSELAVHVPLIIRVPWKTASIGKRTTIMTELVDLYRTLTDLAGFDSRSLPASVQGTSVAPVFDMPAELPPRIARKVAFSQIGRCACDAVQCRERACASEDPSNFDYAGYTLRIPHWRFTAWVPVDKVNVRPDWDANVHLELFDLRGDDGRNFDFDGYSTNVVDRPENQWLVRALKDSLRHSVESWQPSNNARLEAFYDFVPAEESLTTTVMTTTMTSALGNESTVQPRSASTVLQIGLTLLVPVILFALHREQL
eukprot:TRINITY_DN64459_c0_g1_i1.p1 TRINITY_DN64459_c0_g1~~TRINITY_DN64459_c0_g1_i1.p1  ORF type:complete len:752 (+),score=102.28 TRINITY_DN64459_c0_g1_i1:66-2321(+)